MCSVDGVGNVVFMFDVDIGDLFWFVSNSDVIVNLEYMNYSILVWIFVIDRDNDGFVDYMYVVDMGG